MHRSRAPSNWPGPFFAARSWAGCTTNMFGFDLRQAQPPSFDHVLGDARLRDLKPELEQFAVNARRAPKRIFDAHPPDQHAQLRVDLRSPSQWRDFQRQ